MDPNTPETDSDAINAPPVELPVSGVPGCCMRTIQAHARHNPMMVCTECKQIIKCFHDVRPYENYLTFCRSRRRPVLTGLVEGLYTVVFRSYETPVFGSR